MSPKISPLLFLRLQPGERREFAVIPVPAEVFGEELFVLALVKHAGQSIRDVVVQPHSRRHSLIVQLNHAP